MLINEHYWSLERDTTLQVISEQTEPEAIKLQVGLENQKPAKLTNNQKKKMYVNGHRFYTYIFFDVFGFHCFVGVVRWVQVSKNQPVQKKKVK